MQWLASKRFSSVGDKLSSNLARGLVRASMVALCGLPMLSQAAQPVHVMMNWKPEGSNAPFYMALDKGYFAKEGLDVTLDAGSGSASPTNAIAGGAYEAGFGDVNAMIRYDAKFPDNPIVAVLMLYNRAPFSVITMADSGIKSPKDLEGKTMLAPQNDAAYQLFPAFAAANHLDVSKIQFKMVAPNLRDAMLVKHQGQAATGYDSTSWFSMKTMGLQKTDVRYMNYADYGVDLYANALLVSVKFAKAHPDAVKGLVRAVTAAWIDSIKSPNAAIDSLAKYEPTLDKQAEKEKLQWVIDHQIVTPHTKANGLGEVDMARVSHSIDILTSVFSLPTKPKADAVVSTQYLPPAAQRKLP
jgi:NitT/TauT family transport system substrate-binding protein